MVCELQPRKIYFDSSLSGAGHGGIRLTRPFSPRTGSPVLSTRSPAPGSPKFSRKEMQASGSSVDLQGISVKELVKALGKEIVPGVISPNEMLILI